MYRFKQQEQLSSSHQRHQSKIKEIKCKSMFSCNLQNQMKNKLNCFFVRKKKSKKFSQINPNIVSMNTKDFYLKNLIEKKKKEFSDNKIFKKKKLKISKIVLPSVSKQRCVSFDIDRIGNSHSKSVHIKKSLTSQIIRSFKTYKQFDKVTNPLDGLKSISLSETLKFVNKCILSKFHEIPTIHKLYILSSQLKHFDMILTFKAYNITTNKQVIIKQFPSNFGNVKLQEQIIKVIKLTNRMKYFYSKD